MEKIKLEWDKREGYLSSPFFFKNNKLWFGVFCNNDYDDGFLRLYEKTESDDYPRNNNKNLNSELKFSQVRKTKFIEQGRQFCQDWLDALVEKENRIERVQKVLEDIWNGKTELVWEKETVEYMKDNFKAKFLYQNKQYEFYWHFKNTLCIYDSKNYNARDFQFPNQSVRTLEECKTICQDWYNKYLLDQASK